MIVGQPFSGAGTKVQVREKKGSGKDQSERVPAYHNSEPVPPRSPGTTAQLHALKGVQNILNVKCGGQKKHP